MKTCEFPGSKRFVKLDVKKVRAVVELEDEAMSTATFLSDGQIRALAVAGHSLVEPFDEAFLSPASVDLRLGDILYRYKFDNYVLGQDITDGDYEHEKFEELFLEPGQSVFVGISETIRIPENCVGFVFPRSSVTRLGITIPPVYMNPGYTGQLPITVINNATFRVKLLPRVRVAQLLCARLSATSRQPYGEAPDAKYLDEIVSPSKLHSDEEIKNALEQVLRRTIPAKFFASV